VQLIEGTKATAGYEVGVINGDIFISADLERRWALYEIARAQAKAGLIADAMQTARSIESGAGAIGSGLGVVAEGLAEVGRIEEAVSAAAKVGDRYQQVRVLASIAKSRAGVGKFDQALQVARSIVEPEKRAGALASIAEGQAKAGLSAEASATCAMALEITPSIRYANRRVSALLAIARALPH
jgi:hypothetical protein